MVPGRGCEGARCAEENLLGEVARDLDATRDPWDTAPGPRFQAPTSFSAYLGFTCPGAKGMRLRPRPPEHGVGPEPTEALMRLPASPVSGFSDTAGAPAVAAS